MSNEDLAAEEDKREGIDAADLKVSLNFERISRLFPYLYLIHTTNYLPLFLSRLYYWVTLLWVRAN